MWCHISHFVIHTQVEWYFETCFLTFPHEALEKTEEQKVSWGNRIIKESKECFCFVKESKSWFTHRMLLSTLILTLVNVCSSLIDINIMLILKLGLNYPFSYSTHMPGTVTSVHQETGSLLLSFACKVVSTNKHPFNYSVGQSLFSAPVSMLWSTFHAQSACTYLCATPLRLYHSFHAAH